MILELNVGPSNEPQTKTRSAISGKCGREGMESQDGDASVTCSGLVWLAVNVDEREGEEKRTAMTTMETVDQGSG